MKAYIKLKLICLLGIVFLLMTAVQTSVSVALDDEDKACGRTSMSMEDFWYGELTEGVTGSGIVFDLDEIQSEGRTGLYQSGEVGEVLLENVNVEVNKELLANAMAIDALGLGNEQTEAFLSKARQISFDERGSEGIYAVKRLVSSGVFSQRVIHETADAEAVSAQFVSEENGTNAKIYLRVQVSDFDNYAQAFQGAKILYAGVDAEWKTEDDRNAGTVLTLDTNFAEEIRTSAAITTDVEDIRTGTAITTDTTENYLIISVDKNAERFEGMGSGMYEITLIAEGYQDCIVNIQQLSLKGDTTKASD